jgi:hypothetical protein
MLPLPNFVENLHFEFQLGNETRYDPKPGDFKVHVPKFRISVGVQVFSKNRQFGIQTSLLLTENGHSFLKAEYSVVNTL